MTDEWKIGDAIEIERLMFDGTLPPKEVWTPATVCGLNPLTVAFSDGERLALNENIGRRRPLRATLQGNDNE
ncbi:MAG: hypothetical protein Q4G36_08395 [Paracoccus sp. (in: a-proteobacteria)]|nr:hypothetical protein [Paracoccus sp. (in: a-proteobacteria)]